VKNRFKFSTPAVLYVTREELLGAPYYQNWSAVSSEKWTIVTVKTVFRRRNWFLLLVF